MERSGEALGGYFLVFIFLYLFGKAAKNELKLTLSIAKMALHWIGSNLKLHLIEQSTLQINV